MSDYVNIVADRAEAYHHLRKYLRKVNQLNAIQNQILDLQWWEDVCPYFGWTDSVAFWLERG